VDYKVNKKLKDFVKIVPLKISRKANHRFFSPLEPINAKTTNWKAIVIFLILQSFS
jgi:hypothetical protein